MKNIIREYRRIQNWENFFLDSAIYSIGRSVGIEYEDGFQPIAAATGDLFAYMYSMSAPCDSGYTNYVFEPAAVERAFARMGYGCEYISQEQIQEDIGAALEKIRATVDRGVPALAWGCGGVVMKDGEVCEGFSEGSLIGGYDGDVLHVNLYPGPERLMQVDELGYTQIPVRTALSGTQGVFILGEKQAEPGKREIYESALGMIPRFLRMPQTDGFLFGRAAFEKWAQTLRDDAYWQDEQMAEVNCWDRHCTAYCSLCTSIGASDGEGIEKFARKMAAALPDSTVAQAVLPLFVRLRECNGAIWAMHGGFMPPAAELMRPEFRERIAQVLEEMGRLCDEIAAVCIA